MADQPQGAQTPAIVGSAQLTIPKPGELFKVATDVAGVCKAIVVKTAMEIQGKKYVKVEGWEAIAAAHGCHPGSGNVRRVYDEGELIGFAADGYVRNSAGAIIGTAEGYVGLDEKRWKDADEYACRAMAQTRAVSRACRAVFAHVLVLMNENLETVPAEEVNEHGDPEGWKPGQEGAIKDWRDVVIHFGKNRGKALGEVKPGTLRWYQNVDGEGWQGPKPNPRTGKISDDDARFAHAIELSKKFPEGGGDPQTAEQPELVRDEVPAGAKQASGTVRN